MPTCDLQIEFYRPDRTFRTGESVQGWVRVRVDRPVRCRSLHLLAHWGTRGRGNPTRRNYYQETLFQGQWKPEEQYEYSFEFEPPAEPLTYHGHNLNIDHFVSVRADIPWAPDSRREETFWWRPGSRVPPTPPAGATHLRIMEKLFQSLVLLASIILGLAAVFFLARRQWYGILLPAAPLALVWFAFRHKIARWRLGPVQWDVPDQATPGHVLTTKVSIGPGHQPRIRDIRLRLAGSEVVVSGSGSSRNTWHHELASQQFLLAKEPAWQPQQALEVQHTLTFPESAAWSIDLPDNQVSWVLELQIRLGWWSTWSQSRTIRLVPVAVHVVGDNPAFRSETGIRLVEMLGQLAAAGTDQAGIDRLLASLGQRLFDVEITIIDVAATAGQIDDPEYANGRTLSGRLNGAQPVVNIRVTQQHNGQLDRLKPGQSWTGTALITSWDPQSRVAGLLAI